MNSNHANLVCTYGVVPHVEYTHVAPHHMYTLDLHEPPYGGSEFLQRRADTTEVSATVMSNEIECDRESYAPCDAMRCDREVMRI